MSGKVKRNGATPSTCVRFEVHPYKRTPLCKNCSRTLEQHGSQEEKVEKPAVEETPGEKTKVESDMGGKVDAVEDSRRQNPGNQSPLTRPKSNNEVRSSKGQTGSSSVKTEPAARVRSCSNTGNVKDQVKGKVTDTKIKGQSSAIESKSKTTAERLRANTKPCNEVRSKVTNQKMPVAKQRNTGRGPCLTPSSGDRDHETDMTSRLSISSAFENGVSNGNHSSSSSTATSISSSSTFTISPSTALETPSQMMDHDEASEFQQGTSARENWNGTGTLAEEEGSETGERNSGKIEESSVDGILEKDFLSQESDRELGQHMELGQHEELGQLEDLGQQKELGRQEELGQQKELGQEFPDAVTLSQNDLERRLPHQKESVCSDVTNRQDKEQRTNEMEESRKLITLHSSNVDGRLHMPLGREENTPGKNGDGEERGGGRGEERLLHASVLIRNSPGPDCEEKKKEMSESEAARLWRGQSNHDSSSSSSGKNNALELDKNWKTDSSGATTLDLRQHQQKQQQGEPQSTARPPVAEAGEERRRAGKAAEPDVIKSTQDEKIVEGLVLCLIGAEVERPEVVHNHKTAGDNRVVDGEWKSVENDDGLSRGLTKKEEKEGGDNLVSAYVSPTLRGAADTRSVGTGSTAGVHNSGRDDCDMEKGNADGGGTGSMVGGDGPGKEVGGKDGDSGFRSRDEVEASTVSNSNRDHDNADVSGSRDSKFAGFLGDDSMETGDGKAEMEKNVGRDGKGGDGSDDDDRYYYFDDDDNDKEISGNLQRITDRYGSREEVTVMEFIGNKYSQAAEEEFGRIQKLLDKITELEEAVEKLNREKGALGELMSVKRSEFEEKGQLYASRILELEEESHRLRAEKGRLVNLFKLPESDRVSMRALEDELEEMRKRLVESDTKCYHLVSENDDLRREIKDLELEMQEIHDQFQQEESLELRELRKELENTSRDIRLLHFKLRKAERRNDELKNECEEYEEKMKKLEERGKSSEEQWKKLCKVEEELRTAKEVSIQMHDECQRVERERRRLEKELEDVGKPKDTGKGVASVMDDEVSSQSPPKSSELNLTLAVMLERAAEAAKKIPAPTDASNCIQLCRLIEKRLRENNKATDASTKIQLSDLDPEAKLEVILRRGPDTEVKEEWRERENEFRLQVAMAEEESKTLRRKLMEMRTDNDNLMRAVEYLRRKLEQSGAIESPPTKHRLQAITRTVAADSDLGEEEGQGKDSRRPSSPSGDAQSSSRDAGIRRSSSDDLVKDLESQVRMLSEELQRTRERNQTVVDGGDGKHSNGERRGELVDASEINKWKSRMIELQNEIVLITEELQSTTEENERLVKEVTVSRRELENMLETLRRKERQFGEERKVLKRRNNDLSKVFDLLTSRAKRRSTMKTGEMEVEEEEEMDGNEEVEEVEKRRKKNGEDKHTQTEDRGQEEKLMPLEQHALRLKNEKLEKERAGHDLDLKAKDDIIRSKEEVIKRKDFLLNRAVKSLQDLEANIEEKTRSISDKEKELVRLEGEWKTWKERAEAMEKDSRKSEEKSNILEGVVKEKEELLEKTMGKISSMELELVPLRGKVKSLEESIQVKDTELRSVKADYQRIKADLERTKVEIQGLELDRNGLMREKKKIVAEAKVEKEKLEADLEKSVTEKKSAQRETLELERKWKENEEKFKVETDEWKRRLQMMEERMKTEYPKGTDTPGITPSAVYTSVAKANVFQIPVKHETSSPASAAAGVMTLSAASVAGGKELAVHSVQLYRTVEELNPVSGQSEDQSRSRLVAWSSSTDRRSRRNARTASVDRYAPVNTVPVSFTSETSITDDEFQQQQLVEDRIPTAVTERSPSTERPGWSRDRDEQNGDRTRATVAPAQGQTICVAPSYQIQRSFLSTMSSPTLCSATIPNTRFNTMTSLTITTAPGTRIRISRCRRTSDPQISKT